MERARPATVDDAARLVALAEEAARSIEGARGGSLLAATRAAPAVADLRAAIADDAQLVLVGEIDGAIVGFARARLVELADGRTIGEIADLYVEPEGREVGVGEALLERVVEWSRTNRCVGVDAPALPGDRATKNFFEGSRFRARLLVMHHELGGEGT